MFYTTKKKEEDLYKKPDVCQFVKFQPKPKNDNTDKGISNSTPSGLIYKKIFKIFLVLFIRKRHNF